MIVGDSHELATAQKALVHAGTPTASYVDALGRPFLVVDHNLIDTGAEYHETRTALDVQGNVLSVTDAHGRVCMRYTYGMLGQVLKLESLDAGRRWRFDAGNGQPLALWGEREGAVGVPYTQRVVYDALRRPTEVWLDDAGTEKQIQKLSYGEGHAQAAANNLRGRLVEHRDQSGVTTTDDYDFKGNLERQSHKLAADYQNVLD